MLDGSQSALSPKLWLYTNFDCNLKCSYCVTKSTPTAPRRALGLTHVKRAVDEAVALGFRDLFFTGGEPFILDEIHEMLAYASARMSTTVLTNALLLKGRRLDRLCDGANEKLRVQVSLDGSRPEEHDPYRGEGTWARTVASVEALLARGVQVSISTTETPANAPHIDELRRFLRSLGIPDENHVVRPLAKRGFSSEGLDLGRDNLVPEMTITAEGVYWHPLAFPGDVDLLVREEIFPLVRAVEAIQRELEEGGARAPRTKFT
jgi:MoaA/NifB/PqqE/SkfB family radical SAM enzyme